MYGINYNGLKKRKSYEQLLVDIENQPKIKYPDRTAKFLRNSPIISNLLDGDIADLTENDNRRRLLSIGLKIEKNKIREHFIGSESGSYLSADDKSDIDVQSVDEELERRFVEQEERDKNFAEMMKKRLEEEAARIKAKKLEDGEVKVEEKKIELLKIFFQKLLENKDDSEKQRIIFQKLLENKNDSEKQRIIFQKLLENKEEEKEKKKIFFKGIKEPRDIAIDYSNFIDGPSRRNIELANNALKEPRDIAIDYSKFIDGRRRRNEERKLAEENRKKKRDFESGKAPTFLHSISNFAAPGENMRKLAQENRKAENIKKFDAEKKIEPIISSPGSKARARTTARKQKGMSERGKSLEAGTGQSPYEEFKADAGTGGDSSIKQTKKRERSRPPPTQEGGASGSVDTTSLQPVKLTTEGIEERIEEQENRLYREAKEKGWEKEDLNTDRNYWLEKGVSTKNMKRTIDYIRYQLIEYHGKKTTNRISKEEAVDKIIKAIEEKLSKQSK